MSFLVGQVHKDNNRFFTREFIPTQRKLRPSTLCSFLIFSIPLSFIAFFQISALSITSFNKVTNPVESIFEPKYLVKLQISSFFLVYELNGSFKQGPVEGKFSLYISCIILRKLKHINIYLQRINYVLMFRLLKQPCDFWFPRA